MRSKFDQQLALLNDELTQMGETCAKAIGLAAQALENQDAATAAPVAELEEQKNAIKVEHSEVSAAEPGMKICPVCGAESDSKFCPKCGAPMD